MVPDVDCLDNEYDLEELLSKARRSGLVTKQERAEWIKKVLKISGPRLAMKELAGVIGISYNTIQKHWRRGLIPDAIKLGTEGSRCPVTISKQGAIDYILDFEGTDDFDDPRQRKLPFVFE